MKKQILKALLVPVVLLSISCNNETFAEKWWHKLPGWGGYWWQRGQPKSVGQLLEQSTERLADAVGKYQTSREELVPVSANIEKTLQTTLTNLRNKNSNVAEDFSKTESALIELEGKLSVGSRSAYGELASELRAFTEKAKSGAEIPADAFELYNARILFFLANELSMPKPVIN